MNINSIDLNLLISLNKLLELKNVSAAAKEVGVTQPAMSNILSRLRKTFNDELLVKVGRKMDLTPRAKEIVVPLKNIILAIQSQILGTKEFDPYKDKFHFKLSFHDYEQLVIHTKILPLLIKKYPGISIEHIPPKSIHPTDDLGSNAIDFSTSPIVKDRSGILRKRLFTDKFVCLADRRNKILKSQSLQLNIYTQLEHIFIAPHGGISGQADLLLQKKKMKRTIRMSITEFSIAPWLILGTDLIVTLPERAAMTASTQHKDLIIHECPLNIDPVNIYLSWHERLNNSSPHKWLKQLIIDTLN
ncbi:MAG: LysR family transcriptional regulator [Bdellovibrionota bacterium]